MTLTTPLDLIYDEQLLNSGVDTTDSDQPWANYTTSGIYGAISGLNLNYYSAPSGYPSFTPQVAEKAGFVSDSQAVTSWSLIQNWNGTTATPFSQTTGEATNLQVNDGGTLKTVYLFATANPDVVVGRLGPTYDSTHNPAVALVIALDATNISSPDLWVAAYAPLVQSVGGAVPTGVDDNDILPLLTNLYVQADFSTVDQNAFNNFTGIASGQDQFAMVSPVGAQVSGNVDLLFTGLTYTGSGALGTVNVSSTGLGVNSQAIDPTEAIRVDIVNANSSDFAKEAGTGVHYASNISYSGGHLQADWASFQISQVNPTGKSETITIKAYNDSSNWQGTPQHSGDPTFSNAALLNEGTLVAITHYDLLNSSGAVISSNNTAGISGGVLTLTNIPVGEQVKFYTQDSMHTFDRFVVENSGPVKGGPSFDIVNVNVETVTGGTGTDYAELASHLHFEDGGPSISASSPSNGIIHVDESVLNTPSTGLSGDLSGLFTVNYGPDAPALATKNVIYALGINGKNDGTTDGANSGLVDTATGHGIFLYFDSGTGNIIGRVGTDLTHASSSGAVDFTISVDSSGYVTLNQSGAVMHGTGTDPDTSESVGFSNSTIGTANLVTLTATASDSEAHADTAYATAGIGNAFAIWDDGAQHIQAPNGTVSSTAPSSDTETVAFSTATDAMGNDGSHLTIADYADLTSVGLTASLNAAGNDLIYYNGATPVYELKAIDGASPNTGSYEFDVLNTITSPPQQLLFSSIKSGSPQETLTVPAQDGSYKVVFDGLLFFNNGTPVGALGDQTEAQLNHYDDTTATTSDGDQLNPDSIGFGVKNGQASQINDGEGFFFHTDNGTQQLSLQFDVAGIGNVNTINYEYWLFDAAGHEIAGGYQSSSVTNLRSGNQHVNITDSGTPFDTAYVHFFFSPHDPNAGVRIINFTSSVATQIPDRIIHFQLQNTDKDGDFIGSNDYTVTIDNPSYLGTPQEFTLASGSTIAAATINSFEPLTSSTLMADHLLTHIV